MTKSYSTLGTSAHRVGATKRSGVVNSDITNIEFMQRPTTSGAFTRTKLPNVNMDSIGY